MNKEFILEGYHEKSDYCSVNVRFMSIVEKLKVCPYILKDEYQSGWRCAKYPFKYAQNCMGRMEYIKEEYLYINQGTRRKSHAVNFKMDEFLDNQVKIFESEYSRDGQGFWNACKCPSSISCRTK